MNHVNLLTVVSLCFVVIHAVSGYGSNIHISRVQRETKNDGENNSANRGSCTLPNHPDFGKWAPIGFSLNYTVGTSVSQGSILQLSCQNGYKLDGFGLILCQEDGKWTDEFGKCSKTCPPLYSAAATRITCTYKGLVNNCTDATDGTLARFQCAHFHEPSDLSKKPVRLCRDGSWDGTENVECHPVCGRKRVIPIPLILNGATVNKVEYPWQVALYTGTNKTFICGGTLINQRTILTAAHCVTDSRGKIKNKELYTVAVGKFYRSYDDPRDDKEAQFSPLHKIFVAEQYRGLLLNYTGDIAMLVTTKTFTISSSVLPVCVDWGSNYSRELTNLSSYGHVTTWNSTEGLKDLKVFPIPYETCEQRLPEDFNVFLTYDKTCVKFEQGTSLRRGDAGNGLFFKHKDRYYIAGVASLNPVDPDTGEPDSEISLYTNIYKHLDSFILDKDLEYRSLL